MLPTILCLLLAVQPAPQKPPEEQPGVVFRAETNLALFDGPRSGQSGRRTIPVELILLFDVSLSVMNASLLDMLSIKETLLDGLGEHVSISIYAFAARLKRFCRPTRDPGKLKEALEEVYRFEHSGTRLYEGIMETARDSAGSTTAATRLMLVLSDGFSTTKTPPENAARAASALGIPLYPVVLGHERVMKQALSGARDPWAAGRRGAAAQARQAQREARALDKEAQMGEFAALGPATGGRSFDPPVVSAMRSTGSRSSCANLAAAKSTEASARYSTNFRSYSMSEDFLHTTLGKMGCPVHRLGLSASYPPGKKAIYKALDEGLNYFFCFGLDTQMIGVLREVLKHQREKYVVATGAYNYIWWYQNLRRTLEKRLRQLRTDYIDVFHFLGVARGNQFNDRVRAELAELRADPRVRGVSISTHDRKLAGELAAQGALDAMMIRYNAAHRGAELDIFPCLARHDPGVMSFTATRWRYLTRRPRGWPKDRAIPTAGMCYRFVLSNPHVHVCLTAPTNLKQLEENLAAVRQGPLSEEEMQFMREFGDAVYGRYKYFM